MGKSTNKKVEESIAENSKGTVSSKKAKVESTDKVSTTSKVENRGKTSSKSTGMNKVTKSIKNDDISKKKSNSISTDKAASTKKAANSSNKKSTTSATSAKIKDENLDKKSVSEISSNGAGKKAKNEKPTKGAGELLMGLKDFEVQNDNVNRVPTLSFGNNEFVNYNSIKAVLNIGTTQFTKRGIDLISASGASNIVEYVNSYNNIMDARLASTCVDISHSEYVMTFIESINWGIVVNSKTQTVRFNRKYANIRNVSVSSLTRSLYECVSSMYPTINNWIIYTDGTDLRFLGTTIGGNIIRAVSRISKPDFKDNLHKTSMAESTFKSKTMKISIPKNVLSGCIKGIM